MPTAPLLHMRRSTGCSVSDSRGRHHRARALRDPRGKRSPGRHPAADLAIDRRMVEQLEVIGAAEMAVVLDREAQALAALVGPGTRAQHQQVSDEAPG